MNHAERRELTQCLETLQSMSKRVDEIAAAESDWHRFRTQSRLAATDEQLILDTMDGIEACSEALKALIHSVDDVLTLD
jgi:hypothetical protein